jgi:hypothetical protein
MSSVGRRGRAVDVGIARPALLRGFTRKCVEDQGIFLTPVFYSVVLSFSDGAAETEAVRRVDY